MPTSSGIDVRIASVKVHSNYMEQTLLETITIKIKNHSERNVISPVYVELSPVSSPRKKQRYKLVDLIMGPSSTSHTIPSLVTKPGSPHRNKYIAKLLYKPAKTCEPYTIDMTSALTPHKTNSQSKYGLAKTVNSQSYLLQARKDLKAIKKDLKAVKRKYWNQKGHSDLRRERTRLSVSLNGICSRSRVDKSVASKITSTCQSLDHEIRKLAH